MLNDVTVQSTSLRRGKIVLIQDLLNILKGRSVGRAWDFHLNSETQAVSSSMRAILINGETT